MSRRSLRNLFPVSCGDVFALDRSSVGLVNPKWAVSPGMQKPFPRVQVRPKDDLFPAPCGLKTLGRASSGRAATELVTFMGLRPHRQRASLGNRDLYRSAHILRNPQ